mgnify:CR=1 FL=1
MNYQTIVINLVGGPGCGKSTTAAGVFYELKKLGYVCEIVSEFAKDKVWEDSIHTLDNQVYIFGKQYHRLWRLNNKVQFIITDTALPLSIHYSKLQSENFNKLVIELYNQFTNATFFIERGDGYETEGRVQTLEESKEIDNSIINILQTNNIVFEKVAQDKAVEYIVSEIKRYFPIQ